MILKNRRKIKQKKKTNKRFKVSKEKSNKIQKVGGVYARLKQFKGEKIGI